jgi:hypothetical protein
MISPPPLLLLILLLLLLLLILPNINSSTSTTNDQQSPPGLYFYVNQHENVCFVEEITVGATFIATYKHPDAQTKGLKLVLYSPDKKELVSKLALTQGRIAFAAITNGEYKFCIETPDRDSDAYRRPWPATSRTAKVYLKLQVVSSDDLGQISGDIARSHHVLGLKDKLEALSRNVDILLRDVSLARERETHFREQSERINSRVVHWSVFQTCILIISAVLQSLYLRAYFKRKKIA